MKLMRVGAAGQEHPAVFLSETEALDVSSLVTDFDGAFFAGGGVAALSSSIESKGGSLPRIDLSATRIGAPIARPGHLIAIGLNYAAHASEAKEATPSEPVVFSKAPNTVVGPYDDVVIPPNSTKTDWEVELGVVIGRKCAYLASPETALEYVAGYCTSNDVSERENQLERGGQWLKGKSSPTFNPLGPWLVTADELTDPTALPLGLDLGGTAMQSGTTALMVFDVPYLIWYLSQFMTLEPGDLINTGTPSGVGLGMTPQRFLRPGEVMEGWVEGLGRQRNLLVAYEA